MKPSFIGTKEAECFTEIKYCLLFVCLFVGVNYTAGQASKAQSSATPVAS